jgi:uncharacterized tellurite resistance protein B-like protein
MEILIIGAIIFFFYLLSKKGSSTNSSNLQTKKSELDGYKLAPIIKTKKSQGLTQELQFYVSLGNKDFEGKTFTTINFHVYGIVRLLQFNKIFFNVRILDAGLFDAKDNPSSVSTDIDLWTKPDSRGFDFDSSEIEIPYQNTELKDIEFASIPISLLSFPRQGDRKLRFIFITNLKKIMSEDIINLFTLDYKCNIPSLGYRDIKDNEEKAYSLILEIAYLLALSDGKEGKSEVITIKNWIEGHFSTEFAVDMVKSFEAIKGKRSFRLDTVSDTIQKLKDISTKKINYEGLKLFVEIMTIDSKHHENEKALIDKYIELLELDKNEYQKFFNEFVKVDAIKEDLPLNDLGIDDKMPAEEKKKILRKKYVYWSNKINSTSLEERTKAEKIIDLIADERAKLK